MLEGINQPYRVGQTTQEFLLQPYDRLMWEVVMPYIRTTLRYAISVECAPVDSDFSYLIYVKINCVITVVICTKLTLCFYLLFGVLGCPLKTVHSCKYHIFAAMTDIVILFDSSVQKS